ncbi:hypothetical protein [Flavitalea sp.]|nr:hypothetical protein [Flavitalea sp.]
MKSLLRITGLIEAITGIGLFIVPSFLVSILLGSSLTDPVAILTGRLAGATLFTIAIACLFSRDDSQSYLMVKTMLGYNVFSITLLVYAGLFKGISGPGLWPAVFLHAVLLGWCVFSLSKPRLK